MKNFIKKIIKRLLFKSVSEYNSEPLQYRIGLNCIIDASTSFGINTSIGAYAYLHNVQISDFTYLSKNVSMMNTHVGKFCSIAQGVCIGLGDHPSSVFISTHPAFFSPNKQCGYSFTDETHYREMGLNYIGNDVWIGINAVIMNNIKIGNGAIIGAGAIVTKDVPDYAIVAGSPAKLIRYRFSEDEIKTLLEFKWWDKDYKWIEKNYKSFFNMSEFMHLIKSNCV